MEELYRRLVSGGGRVRYERVYAWELEEPEWGQEDSEEGLWVLWKEGGDTKRTWLRRHVASDPPVPPEAVWIAMRIKVIAKALLSIISREWRASAMDMAREVVNKLIDEAVQQRLLSDKRGSQP